MAEMTCIACPLGCKMHVQTDEAGRVQIKGNGCKRGVAYGIQEYTRPMRQVTSTVRVLGGVRPLCAVKTREAVPKEKIADVLAVIRTARPVSPVSPGQIIIPDIAGTGVDLVATADA
ncbi:MAG: DUF1667 domain-containing protein [Clostridia bacterium]|nr:DUF1667 domain-containing protein [Clostridia bacterium]